MPTRHEEPVSVFLGGKLAIGLFVLSLLAFVVETQLTQYVQSDLGFRQPFLLFYIVHSCFALMFPLHIIFLILSPKRSLRTLWAGLIFAIKRHLSSASSGTLGTSTSSKFPAWKFLRLVMLLTAGTTIPSLLWFIAVPLAPITDVTALWNTNAFFAYVFMLILLKTRWDSLRSAAVVLATLGATAVVYGGTTTSETTKSTNKFGSHSPLIGDLLTLVASIVYGLYQVLYKIYAALPFDPDVLETEVPSSTLYTRIPTSHDDLTEVEEQPLDVSSDGGLVYPPPFGLYPNLLTSAIGVCTLLFLWIPIPFLHFFDITQFELPKSALEVVVIAGISLTGGIFNAGFMILLGVWGPIVTSVGSLLTIVLVFISDMIFGRAADSITVWSLLGSGSIIVAFAILAYDMLKGGREGADLHRQCE
ncbi:hypothetical protein AcW2_000859 [Taiwanofungus camphoratus]|nr:hypothetical protein AcW2_000859 [Antrodia cinnamomea]